MWPETIVSIGFFYNTHLAYVYGLQPLAPVYMCHSVVALLRHHRNEYSMIRLIDMVNAVCVVCVVMYNAYLCGLWYIGWVVAPTTVAFASNTFLLSGNEAVRTVAHAYSGVVGNYWVITRLLL
jgi:hypothetical protein